MCRLRFELRSRAEPVKSAGHCGQRVMSVLEEEEGVGAEKDDPGDVVELGWAGGE